MRHSVQSHECGMAYSVALEIIQQSRVEDKMETKTDKGGKTKQARKRSKEEERCECYGMDKLDPDDFFTQQHNTNTRGHS